MASHLSTKQGYALALSATAPWYSLLVTAPIIAQHVGSGVALVYLLAAIPAIMVAQSMTANDRRNPHNGTIFSWARSLLPKTAWFGGFCLAVTGILATASMAYVAATIILPTASPLLVTVLALAFIAIATIIDLTHIKIMATLQYVATLLALLAAGMCAWWLATGALTLKPLTGDLTDWLTAILLAVFAYWGFDAIFALTEETDEATPHRVTWSTLVTLIALYIVGGTAYAAQDTSLVSSNPLIAVAVFASAVMSLGSTIVPTINGLQAMAQHNAVPRLCANLFTRNLPAAVTTATLTGLAVLFAACNQPIFDDSIEALSVLVGIYFTISAYTASRYADTTARRIYHLSAAGLMTCITGAVLVASFSPDYGTVSYHGIGAVALLSLAMIFPGILGSYFYSRKTS